MKKTLAIFSTAFLLGCGQNAFLESKLTKSISGVSTEKDSQKDSVAELLISLHSRNLDLGLVPLNKEIEVPLLIKNDGQDVVEKIILSSGSKAIKTLAVKDGMLESGESIVASVLLTRNELGAFTESVTIEYQTRSLEKKKEVLISGTVTSDSSNVGASVEPTRSDDYIVDLGRIPTLSLATHELLLKNTGLSSALVTSITLENGTHFSLDEESINSCLGQLVDYCSVTASYKPLEIGKHFDNIIIEYTDASGKKSKQTIKVTGEGSELNRCINKNTVAHLPLSKEGLKNTNVEIELPYSKSSSRTLLDLNELNYDESNREVRSGDHSVFYVQDAQVVSVFDLAAKRKSGTIIGSSLNVDILKSIDESEYHRHHKTEVVCYENILTCSGQRFLSKLYKNHINEKYSVDGNIFSQDIMKSSLAEKRPGLKLYRMNKTYKHSELLPQKSLALNKKLGDDEFAKIIFADDIKVQGIPQLNTTYLKVINNSQKCEE